MGAVLVRNHGQSVTITAAQDLDLNTSCPVYSDQALTQPVSLPYLLLDDSIVYMTDGDKRLTFDIAGGDPATRTERVIVQRSFRQTIDLPGGSTSAGTAMTVLYADGVAATVVDRPSRVLASGFADPTAALNSTTGLARARDQAGVNGTVVLDGTFLVDGLTLLSGQTLDALPGATLRLANSSAAGAVVDALGNCTIKNLKIDGNRANQSASGLDGTRGLGLRIRNADDVKVENVQIVDCIGEGILLDHVNRVTVRGGHVVNCNQGSNRKAVLLLTNSGSSTDVTIDNVSVDSSTSGSGGISFANNSANPNATVSGIRVRDCDVQFGGGGGYQTLGVEMWTNDPVSHPVTDVTVVGNHIRCTAVSNQAFGVSMGGVSRGVVLGNSVDSCTTISYENLGQHLTCSGNVSSNSGYLSVGAAWASQPGLDITVQGNSINGSSTFALEVNGSIAVLSNCIISGNIFDGTYINAQGSTQGITLSNNLFDFSVAGLTFGTSATPVGWVVTGNLFDLTGITAFDGIILVGGSDISITNNTFKGGRKGIYALYATNDVTVFGNKISGCAAEGIRTDSACDKWSIAANAITGCTGKGIVLAGSPTGMALGSNRVSNNTGGAVDTTGAGLVSLV